MKNAVIHPGALALYEEMEKTNPSLVPQFAKGFLPLPPIEQEADDGPTFTQHTAPSSDFETQPADVDVELVPAGKLLLHPILAQAILNATLEGVDAKTPGKEIQWGEANGFHPVWVTDVQNVDLEWSFCMDWLLRDRMHGATPDIIEKTTSWILNIVKNQLGTNLVDRICLKATMRAYKIVVADDYGEEAWYTAEIPGPSLWLNAEWDNGKPVVQPFPKKMPPKPRNTLGAAWLRLQPDYEGQDYHQMLVTIDGKWNQLWVGTRADIRSGFIQYGDSKVNGSYWYPERFSDLKWGLTTRGKAKNRYR
jgi:hypothetical protein